MGIPLAIDNGSGTLVDDNYTPFTESAIGGDWWNPSWPYRKVITIDNQANSSALADYPVLVTVDTAGLIAAGKLNVNGGDLRFVDGTSELNFWVESGMNTPSTRIWVKVPAIPAAATKSISMYFGNTARTISRSDGAKTFPLFDNFGGTGWEGYKYPTPVMGPGSTAGGSGTFSSVLRESDTFWRMYSSYDSDGNDIGMSTSSDGIHWTHQGVVLRKGPAGAWDSANVWCPAVWKENGTYYMMYPGTGSSSGINMGLATSPDGVNFTKYSNNPVFNDPNWATGYTESPCFSVLKDNGTYYVMYNTLGAGKRQSSIAYSTDLINWTPAYTYPRFPGGTDPSDWNYHTFCGHMFKYEDLYYIIFPGQDSSHRLCQIWPVCFSQSIIPRKRYGIQGHRYDRRPASGSDGRIQIPPGLCPSTTSCICIMLRAVGARHRSPSSMISHRR